ncbi:MAG: GNAT family N-acetyltransferase [Acidobacteria bacterium]|nr:GNAT family N-acetyltransferase [Acidobacteriota bacterium]
MDALAYRNFASVPRAVNTFDELETARLRLRMFAPGDAFELSAITRDPKVMRYIGEGRPISAQETAANLDSIINAFRRRGFGRWAVIHKDSGRLIGYCGFSTGIPAAGVELAYMLARSFWGYGLATEAARACLRYGFEELRLSAISAITRPSNRRSRRVMEHLAMKFLCEKVYLSYDCVHYSIDRNDFTRDDSTYILHNSRMHDAPA